MCHLAISYVTSVHPGLSATDLLTAVTKSWERFRLQILKLPLEQQIALYNWLAQTITQQQSEAAELSEIPLGAGRAIVESKQVGKITYRLELVKCGKLACRCAIGQLHGPYWYAYQRQGGKVKSWYVGKQLPHSEDWHKVRVDGKFLCNFEP